MYKLGINADLIIGDLDSINLEALDFHKMSGAQIAQHSPDKDKTDMELAISCLPNYPKNEIYLSGMEGGRSDHSYMNLLVLKRFIRKGLLSFDTNDGFGGVVGPGTISLKVPINSGAALISLSTKVSELTSEGVAWPLVKSTLKFGEARGISNKIISQPWNISFEKGVLAFFVRGLSRGEAEIGWHPSVA